MALNRTGIIALICRDVGVPLTVGLSAGLAITLAGARTLTAMLYGLTAHDPSTLVKTAAVLIITAAIAALVPAMRAASVDPAVALRHQ